ncbi:MAG: TIGR01777 family oxidoreductase [Kofleriaceae bacterium]|nr:TIGR01777 family oxidoreductase [Kofleriaceae bacterium]
MQIFISGATGLLGRALSAHLLGRGHAVTAWVRDPVRAEAALGPDVARVTTRDTAGLEGAISSADAVVHLAGAPIVGKRWTASRKRELIASRVDTARTLAAAIRARPRPLPVLVSASAVGYYGDRGDEELAESAPRGQGFAAELCEQWEQAALEVGQAASRVVCARIGIVLARNAGALGPLGRLARLGLAGPISKGTQWVPWIHLDDVVRALTLMIEDTALSGPVNVVGPAPVRQRELASALGRSVDRPAFVPAPRLALRVILGEAAAVLVASQRVLPIALERAGFAFRFATLDAALDDVMRDHGVEIRAVSRAELPQASYFERRTARYVLSVTTTIDRPLSAVLPFFADAQNLSVLTPPWLEFAITTPRPIVMNAGATIDYQIKLSGIPLTWRTVIERWEPTRGFVDAQHGGPYEAWWHEHRFRADGDRTLMEDVVYYAPRFGLLGRIANRLFVARQLRAIFAYRGHAIRLRFGSRDDAQRAVPVRAERSPALTTLH